MFYSFRILELFYPVRKLELFYSFRRLELLYSVRRLELFYSVNIISRCHLCWPPRVSLHGAALTGGIPGVAPRHTCKRKGDSLWIKEILEVLISDQFVG